MPIGEPKKNGSITPVMAPICQPATMKTAMPTCPAITSRL